VKWFFVFYCFDERQSGFLQGVVFFLFCFTDAAVGVIGDDEDGV
jgi:hypothetical protein